MGQMLFLLSILVFLEFTVSSSLVDSYKAATKDSLLWGAYRPNAYLGIRPRLPRSLLSGLFWFNADKVENVQNMRHYCDQNLDFDGFGWERYDPRIGGRQVFKDNEFKVDITTDFVKNDEGNWALKVKGVSRKGFENQTLSIVFYTGLEGEGMLTSASGNPYNGFDKGEEIVLIGQSDELSDFMITINDGPDTNEHKHLSEMGLLDASLDPSKTHYLSLRVPDDNLWKVADIFKVLIQDSIKKLSEDNADNPTIPDTPSLLLLRNLNNFEGNLHLVQKTFTGSFEFDVIFNKEQSHSKFTKENINDNIEQALKKIDLNFDKSFELQAPFTQSKYENFAKEVFSNLLGNIGYYYGDHLVDRESEINEETHEQIKLDGKFEGPFELFTGSPSRTFFPRGFYWDEGFHLIPMIDYDSDLVLEILKSWFNLIDEDGWIAREQILGPEARSKVPQEFQVQSPKIANPPTLMMVFADLLKKANQLAQASENEFGDIDDPEVIEDYGHVDFKGVTDAHFRYPELLTDYAQEIYPKLQKHYEWFRKTQKGELEEFDREPHSPNEAYRWKGRTFKHCLPSGLDDYPRAEVPDVAELNVDLISWIGTMTRSMKDIAKLLGKKDDEMRYASIEKDIQQNIEDLHWSEEEKAYCDVSVDENDEDVFVCHKGYISLFPFLLQYLEPSNPHLKHIIDLIADPNELWSNFGVRSLSKRNPHYKTGENYWKSPVWYPINYLILKSLEFYGSKENREQLDDQTFIKVNEVYKQLRVNLVQNCYKNWLKTGYLFEHYDDVTGEGKGAKHFTGWTALVSMMMKMPESLY